MLVLIGAMSLVGLLAVTLFAPARPSRVADRPALVAIRSEASPAAVGETAAVPPVAPGYVCTQTLVERPAGGPPAGGGSCNPAPGTPGSLPGSPALPTDPATVPGGQCTPATLVALPDGRHVLAQGCSAPAVAPPPSR